MVPAPSLTSSSFQNSSACKTHPQKKVVGQVLTVNLGVYFKFTVKIYHSKYFAFLRISCFLNNESLFKTIGFPHFCLPPPKDPRDLLLLAKQWDSSPLSLVSRIYPAIVDAPFIFDQHHLFPTSVFQLNIFSFSFEISPLLNIVCLVLNYLTISLSSPLDWVYDPRTETTNLSFLKCLIYLHSASVMLNE